MDGELLPYGAYRYRLSKNMYHQETGEIGVEKGRVEKNIVLQPAFGYLDIKTQPTGVQVVIDGQDKEYTSPCKPQLSSGTYKVRLIKRLYGTYEQNVTVRDNQTVLLNATLEPKFARLVVNSFPGASVYVDGKAMGKGPKYEVDLLEGLHDIEVQLASHKTVRKQIEIIAKKNQEISLNPTPIFGALDIKSGSTNDATIFIDNKNYGKAPQVIYDVLVGKHTVKLEKAGYESIVKEVVVEDGEMFLFDAKMEKRPIQLPEAKMGKKTISLTVTPSYTIFPAAGGIKTLMVSPHNGWRLENVPSWLTIKSGDGYIQVKAKENRISSSRFGSFFISTPTERKQISVSQQYNTTTSGATNPRNKTLRYDFQTSTKRPKKNRYGYKYILKDYFSENHVFNVDWIKIGLGTGWAPLYLRAELLSMRMGLFELRPSVFGSGQGPFKFSWDPSIGVVFPINNSWAGVMRGGLSILSSSGIGGYFEFAAIVNYSFCLSSDLFIRTMIYNDRQEEKAANGWSLNIGATFNITRIR
ncbi:MAG: PEGA domain-containing protein [Bacteroides sp.]|nr:PEGA domain-containing protein [Bacteroides sp.]